MSSNAIGLSERVTTYAPILLTAEDAINGSVRLDDEKLRAQAQGLSRAVGARGQMFMQQLLVEQGGELPEPELRTTMITVAGTEPSTLFDMSQVLGVGSPDAEVLQGEMVRRMGIMSNPDAVLVGNLDLRQSLQATDLIAGQVVKSITAQLTDSVRQLATDRRNAVIRDALLTLGAFVIALLVVFLVARSLVRPLRTLRDSALRVAHDDLAQEIDRVRAGDERDPEPMPVYTTEEVGQVAHAVDELHEQAVLLAGDQARLQLQVNDMFETMSRRNRSLVDQQLSLIDRLERNEKDPERLESLFRLDHLATRMRRNGANLLVLAGAQVSRDSRQSLPLAARSTPRRPRSRTTRGWSRRRAGLRPHRQGLRRRGAPAGRAARQRAALLTADLAGAGDGRAHRQRRSGRRGPRQRSRHDRHRPAGRQHAPALRRRGQPLHRPPHGSFRRRPAGAQHGMVVRLRNTIAGQPSSGTTAELYIPPGLLEHGAPIGPDARPFGAAATEQQPVTTTRTPPDTPLPPSNCPRSGRPACRSAPRCQWHHRRSVPQPTTDASRGFAGRGVRATRARARPTVDTSSFFTSRDRAAKTREETGVDISDMDVLAADLAAPETDDTDDTDFIYQKMLSEFLVDPRPCCAAGLEVGVGQRLVDRRGRGERSGAGAHRRGTAGA